MYRVDLGQPYVPVYAASGIPSRIGLVAVVHPYGDDVFPAPSDIRGKVVPEGYVSVRACAEFMAVDIDGGVHVDTVEIDVDHFAAVCRIKRESLAVPSCSARESPSARSGRIVDTEIPVDGPVVRQVEDPPSGIIVFRITELRRIIENE